MFTMQVMISHQMEHILINGIVGVMELRITIMFQKQEVILLMKVIQQHQE